MILSLGPKFQVNRTIRCRAGDPQYLEKGVNFFSVAALYLQLLSWLHWSIHKPHQREEGHKLGAGLEGQDRDIEPTNAANY